MTILAGHTDAATAYVVNDYPYGFRLRCRIRYWLEYKRGKGVRFVSQTTNPKRGDVWNKPKASTYCRFGGAMYLDDAGHVQWSGLHEYTDGAEVTAWRSTYGAGVAPGEPTDVMNEWVAAKVAYEAARAAGAGHAAAVFTAHKAFCDVAIPAMRRETEGE